MIDSETLARAERAFERGDYASCRVALRDLREPSSALESRLAPDPGTGAVAVAVTIIGLVLALYYTLQ